MLGWRRWLAALTALLATGSASPAGAAAGDLDPAFDEDGRVALFSSGPFVPRAVAVQPDGRIVVAGYACSPGPSGNGLCQGDGDSSFRLARFTADGALDLTWGEGGVVTTPVGSGRSQAFDLILRPGGRIVAGGVARDATGRDVFALAAYDARGEPDAAFGSDGAVLTRAGTGFAAAADLAVDAAGRIVTAGQAVDAAGRERIAVARYRADGGLDGSFGTFGTLLAGAAPYGYGSGGWVAPGGAVMAAGVAGASGGDPSSYRTGVVRASTWGVPDPGFSADGATELAVGSSSSFANALTGLPDGRWLAAGAATDEGGRQVMAIVRGRPDGSLDPAWDRDGVALARTLEGAVAADVLRLPDGRVVAAGQATGADGEPRFALARLDAGGRLDRAFGGGVVTTSWTSFRGVRATSAAVDAGGRIVVAGIGCRGGEGPRCQYGTAHLALARYLG